MKRLDIDAIDYSGRVIEGQEVFYVRYYTTTEIKNRMTFWQKWFLSSVELCEITNTVNANLYHLVLDMSKVAHKRPTAPPLSYR